MALFFEDVRARSARKPTTCVGILRSLIATKYQYLSAHEIRKEIALPQVGSVSVRGSEPSTKDSFMVCTHIGAGSVERRWLAGRSPPGRPMGSRDPRLEPGGGGTVGCIGAAMAYVPALFIRMK